MKLGLYRTQSPSSAIESTHLFLPDGPTYLAAYLEKYLGYSDTIIEYDIDKLLKKKPDIIGLSAVTESINKIYEIAERIKKEHDIPVIIGGPHITYLPQSLPKTIDIGVLGEGEVTFTELIKLALNNGLVPDNLKNIEGIVYHNSNGELTYTNPRPLISNIDDIPLPWRKVSSDYNPVYQNVFTSRGCPYKCTYCIETRFWTRTRFHSPERVVEEIRQIVREHPYQDSIAMGDTIFAMNKKRLIKIAELIREEGLHKKVYFSCNARANIFDEDVCNILKSMNVKQINFGFESGSDNVLDFLKGSVKAIQNEKALELAEKNGFFALGHIIIGAPIETHQDISQSYWFLRRNEDRIWRTSVHPMTPFPGSYIWNYSVEKNLIDETFSDWENFNLSHIPSVFLNEHYTPTEYLKMGVWFDEYMIKKQSPENFLIHHTNKDKYYEFIYNQLYDIIKNQKDINILEISNSVNKFTDKENFNLNINRIETQNGYLETEEVEDKKFDYIFLIHSLEKLRNPEKALIKLKSLLTEKGKIISVFFNSKNVWIIKNFLEKGGLDNLVWGPTNIKNFQMLTIKNVNNYFKKAGFDNLKIIHTNLSEPDKDDKIAEILKSLSSTDENELNITSFITEVSLNKLIPFGNSIFDIKSKIEL